MKLRIQCLQHVSFEGPAYLQVWAEARNHAFSLVKLYEKQPLPSVDELDFLIIMGGSMGVNDDFKYPWMEAEKELIRQCILSGKIVLGICLGAQLMASAMHAPVVSNRWPEIGWFPLIPAESGPPHPLLNGIDWNSPVFHWHGDTFGIPAGAKHLLKSEACVNQAFLIGEKALALQFHLEMTQTALTGMIENCGAELLENAPYIQTADDILAKSDLLKENQKKLEILLDRITI